MNYEIFISYKASDEDGNITRDYYIAEELYNTLRSMGYNVFFSADSLEKIGSDRYKMAIDDALDIANIMVVVASSAEYVSSKWVRYEWDSFYNDYLSGIKPEPTLYKLTKGINS